MRLLSEAPFDIRTYFGNLVILYPEGRGELIAELRERLDHSGHVYHCCAVGGSLLQRGDGFDEIVGLLDRCECLIPVLDRAFLTDKTCGVARAMLWHFVGYMRASRRDAIVPFLPRGEGEERTDLRGTPLQGVDIMYDADTFMRKVPAKFSGKLLCYDYYENRRTNFYASKRIRFRCMSLSFDIYQEAFDNAREYYSDVTGLEMSEAGFDSYLERHLLCGCRVVSFGTESKLEPQMMVYKDEVHPYVADYPRTMVGKKSYRPADAEEWERGIRAHFTMDVLIPVHKLLGAYIKCYLTCPDSDCPVTMLLALLQPDFADGAIAPYDPDAYEEAGFWQDKYPAHTYVDERLNRLYFSLEFESDEPPMKADPSLCVGDTLDFVYPQ